MTQTRNILPALRSAAFVAVGTALMLAPLPLDLGAAALVTGMAAGTIAMALALAGTATDGRGTLPRSALAAYERGLGFGAVLAGLAFGLAGNPAAFGFFAAVGLVSLAVSTVTRLRTTLPLR